MRLSTALLTGTLLVAGPALAQDGGNVGQPSRTVPQAGQTTGGPRGEAPLEGGAAGAVGGATRPVGERGVSPGVGAVDSAKAGNADDNDRAVPNTGGTSGGPAR